METSIHWQEPDRSTRAPPTMGVNTQRWDPLGGMMGQFYTSVAPSHLKTCPDESHFIDCISRGHQTWMGAQKHPTVGSDGNDVRLSGAFS